MMKANLAIDRNVQSEPPKNVYALLENLFYEHLQVSGTSGGVMVSKRD